MIGVILNPRSGYVARYGIEHVCAMIVQAVPNARVHLLEPHDDVPVRCQEFLAQGATCIAAAGGDGTVSSVAGALAGTNTPLGVIPAGTLNHFARDVGVGRRVEEALKILAGGYVMPVDVATVNGHIFLNNSSIGLYPRMVEIRKRYEKRLGKWRAMIYATLLIARRADPSCVQIADGTKADSVRAELLFVGNNQYELDLLHIGRRHGLDAGELCCFILEMPNRFRLWRNIIRYLRDTHPAAHLFRSLRVAELTVVPQEVRGRSR